MSQPIEENIAAGSPEKVFKPQELEQMLAPIALYPDALLAQVLTAATYPLEVVEADRFVKENQGLKGEALLEAAGDKDWEPSVKAMLEFPDILAMMDEQLEWTKKLGDAFLIQQSDCMDAIQRLRQKAYAQGNLATTEKQVIRVEPQTQIIIIEPASPEVVYVPVYDTTIIYGDWWYPAYPPYYFYPRRYSGISFFSGVFVGTFWGAWGAWDCNWYSRHVDINLNHYNNFTKIHYRSGNYYRFYQEGQDNQPWRHDPQHRGSVRYEKQRPSSTVRPSTPDFRKYDQGTVNPPTISSSEKARPTINTSKSDRDNQPGIKKLPARILRESAANHVNTNSIVTVNSRSDAGNYRGIKASTSDSKAQEATGPSTLMSNVKDDIKEKVIARPALSDSNRNKDDTHALTARGAGRHRYTTNNNLQPDRQIPAPSKGSGVLREVPINVVAP